MKTFSKLAGCLVLLLAFLVTEIKAQVNPISVYTYAYVEASQMPEFNRRMETYWYKVAEAATSDNLQFFAYLTKVDGFDLPNNSNVLIIAGYKDMDKMSETWNPSALFPDKSMDEMTIWNISTLKHRIFVQSQNWAEKEGVNPETDFNYIRMVYHDTETPAELIAMENEHWGTFIKKAMDEGKTNQKGWGNAVIVAPTNPNMGATTISFDLYSSMNDVFDPGWPDDMTFPDGLEKIMEAEQSPRRIYTYRIQHVVQAPQPN